MGDVCIEARHLGKRFQLGVGSPGQTNLRETLYRVFRSDTSERKEVWALRGLDLDVERGEVLGIVGPNGAGKTTSIGKLAKYFQAHGKSVLLAAGDTFRAAAVEQLQIWGQRAGVPVMTAPQGSDPASLAFDAMARAEAEGADLLLIDTAGRLQNKTELMAELEKIVGDYKRLVAQDRETLLKMAVDTN